MYFFSQALASHTNTTHGDVDGEKLFKDEVFLNECCSH